MKYVGMAVILCGVMLFCREYVFYRRKRLCECEGFASLLLYMRTKLSCYLFTMREVGENFECEALLRVGLLSALKECGSAEEAYTNIRDRLSISREADGILMDLFKKLGTGYLDDEISLIDMAHTELLKITEAERRDTPKDLKIALTLSTSVGIGLIIAFL